MAPAGLPSCLPAGDPLYGGVVDLLVLALSLVFVLAHFPGGDPLHRGVVDLHVLPLALVLVVACFPVGDPLGAADFPFLVLDLLVLGLPLHGGGQAVDENIHRREGPDRQTGGETGWFRLR